MILAFLSKREIYLPSELMGASWSSRGLRKAFNSRLKTKILGRNHNIAHRHPALRWKPNAKGDRTDHKPHRRTFLGSGVAIISSSPDCCEHQCGGIGLEERVHGGCSVCFHGELQSIDRATER